MRVLKRRARNPVGTLAAWLKRSGAYGQAHKSGAVAVYEADRLSQALQWDLYHLKDYAVSSVSGPVTWLVRRNPLTRSEALVVAKRAQHSLREARGLDGYPSSLVYAGRAAAYRDVVQDFTARRNPRRPSGRYSPAARAYLTGEIPSLV